MFFLDRAERINPMAEVIYAKGALAKETSKPEEAAELFSKALKLQPNNLDYLRQAGIVQLMLENIEPALAYFDQVLQRNKDDKVTLGNSGICLIRLRRIDEAILTILQLYSLISTEEEKLEFKNVIKILTASFPVFGARISQMSVMRHLDDDLLLLYIATFTNMITVRSAAKILHIDL